MIRSAQKKDAKKLTHLSFESKKYWGYPEGYFNIWKNELTITMDYIEKNDLFLFEKEGEIAGFYSLIELKADIVIYGVTIHKGFWLDHMFVLPAFIGKRIGTQLFAHLKNHCRTKKIKTLSLLADPNSRGFYEKMGCCYQKEVPSSIADRTTPLLELYL